LRGAGAGDIWTTYEEGGGREKGVAGSKGGEATARWGGEGAWRRD